MILNKEDMYTIQFKSNNTDNKFIDMISKSFYCLEDAREFVESKRKNVSPEINTIYRIIQKSLTVSVII